MFQRLVFIVMLPRHAVYFTRVFCCRPIFLYNNIHNLGPACNIRFLMFGKKKLVSILTARILHVVVYGTHVKPSLSRRRVAQRRNVRSLYFCRIGRRKYEKKTTAYTSPAIPMMICTEMFTRDHPCCNTRRYRVQYNVRRKKVHGV